MATTTREQRTPAHGAVVDYGSSPPSEGSLTPRASQENLDAKKTAAAGLPTTKSQAIVDSDAASSIAPSSYAQSTLPGYAQGALPGYESRSSLLRDRQSIGIGPSSRPQKTVGRKVYEGFCDAVQIVIPLDMNDNCTSMRESSLGKLAKAAHVVR